MSETGALHPGSTFPHGKAMSPEAERLRASLSTYRYPNDIARIVVTELGITEEMVETIKGDAKRWEAGTVARSTVDAAAAALATLLEVAVDMEVR